MSLVLSPKQKDFYKNSTAKINIAHGSVRSGKTFISNLRWLHYIRHGSPGKLLMSGRTKDSLRENVLQDLFEIVGEENYHYDEQKGILRMFGRRIEIRGAEKANDEKRIRGRTYAGWYADEVTIQHKSFVQQAIARCSVTGAQLFWTTNPDHPKHYINTDFIKSQKMLEAGQVKVWHFLMDDNRSLDQEYRELLRNSYHGVFYQRNILGLWVIAEGVVYGDSYKPEKHRLPHATVQQMIADRMFKEYIAGTDWGYTHPMVGLVYGVTRDNKRVQVGEYYRTKQPTEDLGAWYLEQEKRLGRKITAIYCDDAEPDRIETLQKMGLNAVPAVKSIMAGINTVMVEFANDRLFIDETCTNTDNELQTYRFPDEDDAAAAKDQPLDEDNHAMDGKRYAIHTHTYHGPARVTSKPRGM